MSDSDMHGEAQASRTIADQILFLRHQLGLDTTPMQIIKLVYICHGWMLGIHARKLCFEPAEAWRYGPVIPDVYFTFKSFGGKPIDVHPRDSFTLFDEEQNSILEEVVDKYQTYKGWELSSITHKKGTPWHTVYNNGIGLGSIIPDELIREYYDKLANG